MRYSPPRALLAAVASLALLASGCTFRANDGAAALRTGPGVTQDTIYLGALSDLTGPFGTLGKTLVQGNQLYFDKVNAAGGICGRQVKLVVKDHGYDVQRAIADYDQMERNVLGFVQMLGSPMTAALEHDILQDQVVTAPASWSSYLLRHPYLMVTGTTYDVEMINAMDYLVKQNRVGPGDTVGHIYLDGEYGGNALQGSTFAANQLGVKLEPVKADPTAKDFAAQIMALKAHRAKAILVSVSAPQTAAIAAVAKAVGFDGPIVTNSPGFVPALLQTPAGPALEQNLLMVASFAPFGADLPAAKDVAASYRAKYPSENPNAAVIYGYAVASAFGSVLRDACAAKDLTRDGVHRAFRNEHTIDTGGLNPRLHFSDAGKPSTDEVYVVRPDAKVPGGLVIIKDLFVSNLAGMYEVSVL